ncbi:MAG: LysR family transcriptional regulator [Oscillospiraceae bacterium]|nr:LysR family transcriptional regulator [Oscillospiraceae bacterium]
MNPYLAFLRVLECNSFSDAARVMGYTQSAVSQMMKALEEELGVTLLLRSRTGVTLTREGELLLPYIRDVANAHRMLSEQAANFRGLQRGTIRIGTFTSISSQLLPPVMKAFREAHPNLRFELHQGLYSEIEEWVRTGVVDFGFTDASRVTPFVCEPVFQDTMLAVLPEGHPLGENIFVQVGQLKQEPFILLDEGRGGGIVHDMVAAHPEIDVQYRVADDYSILTMVENSLGIAVLPELVLKNTNHRVIARQLQPQLRRTLGVIYPKREGLSTAARAFLRELRTALK